MTVRRTLQDDDLDPNDLIVGDADAVDLEVADAARLHAGEDLFDPTLWVDWYGLRMSRARPEVYVEALRAAILKVPLVRSAVPRTFSLGDDRNLSVIFDVRLQDGSVAAVSGLVSTASEAATPSGARLYWVST